MTTEARAAAALRAGSSVTAALLALGLVLGGLPVAGRCLAAGLACAILTPVARLVAVAVAEARSGHRDTVAATGLTAVALAAAVAVALASGPGR